MSTKRSRISSSSSSSSSSSVSPSPTPKASRTLPISDSTGEVHSLLCTLPPTCNHRPTPIANSRDLEAHYATYHAHVCEEPGCRCVFPDAKLLELHLTECHDSIAAVRRERGEKIFACFLSTCSKRFLTPKARRLHLIQAHAYPKEYFFAVTNKGVGGLLKKWGEGASMIRREWKSRGNEEENSSMIKFPLTEGGETQSDTENTTSDNATVSEDAEAEIEVEIEGSEAEGQKETNGNGAPYTRRVGMGGRREQNGQVRQDSQSSSGDDAMAVDTLVDSMSSLSLVPSHIRFGRGGTRGFTHPHGYASAPQTQTHAQASTSNANTTARGRIPTRGGGGYASTDGHNNHALNDTRNSTNSSPAPAFRGRGNFRGRPGIIPMRGGIVGPGHANGNSAGNGHGYAGPAYRFGRARGRGAFANGVGRGV